MASILVYIEIDGEHPARASVETLGEARRIATELGGALYAFVAAPGDVDAELEDRWVETLGRAGADKVVVMAVPRWRGPALWSSCGRALHAGCVHVAPTLVLLAATATGRDIAPRLAARMGATFLAQPRVERTAGGQIVLARPAAGGARVRQVSLEELCGCAVITLSPGSCAPATGDDEAEALRLEPPDSAAAGELAVLEYLGSDEDPGGVLDHARVIVVAGGGVPSAAAYARLGELARAVGGELAATPALCERGIAPPERVIGVGLRHVAPALYVVCAAAGSRGHLDAVAPGAEIIAINSDPDAPIFRVASHGVVGDIETVVPALLEALGQQHAQPVMAAT